MIWLAILCNLAFVSVAVSVPIQTPVHMFFFKVEQGFNDHPGEYPFPTDLTFRQKADHVIDAATEYFDPELVKKGDTIFLNDWYQAWFVKYVHPQIKDPYILISNDSDAWHPWYSEWDGHDTYVWPPPRDVIRTLLYDSKVAAWLCKNMLLSKHPKVIQIPIGQSIIWWGGCLKGHLKDHLIKLSIQENVEKRHLLYMNMQLACHPSRAKVFELFKDKTYCFQKVAPNSPTGKPPDSTILSKEQFYEELSQSFFTLAPPGNGPDTCRFWESVVVGCIPIAIHSPLDDLYSDTPALLVHQWEDINLEWLLQKREEIAAKNLKKDKAFYDYWDQKIKEMQKRVRDSTNDFSHLEKTQFQPKTLEILTRIIKGNVQKNDRMLYRGSAVGLRPFEVMERCSFLSALYIQDRWGAQKDEAPYTHLRLFTNNPLKYVGYNKIIPLNIDELNFLTTEGDQRTHVFFDLSYLRHELTEDLERFYTVMSFGTFFCGNMAEDSYVQELLDRFSVKFEQKIVREGDIWFFKK